MCFYLIKHFFYSSLLGVGIILLLISCIKDPLLDDCNDNEIYGNHLSLAIMLPFHHNNSITRVAGNDAESLAEVLVDGVRIVLYSNAYNRVEYCRDLDIQLGVSNLNTLTASGSDLYSWRMLNERILIQTQAQEEYSGDSKLLVIVNPNAAVKAITEVGSTLSAIVNGTFDTTTGIHALYRTANNIPGIANGAPVYFLMLNHQGLIPLTKNDYHDTKKAAESNPVSVKVEHLVAKVSCNYDTSQPEDMDPADADDWHPGGAPYGRFVMLLDNYIHAADPALPWGEDYDIPDFPEANEKYNWNRITKQGTPKTSTLPAGAPVYYHTANEQGLTNTMVRYLTATDIEWLPDVVNKKSYWLRHITHKAGSLGMEKQGDTDWENFYAEDPNFTVSGTTSADFHYLTIDDFEYTNRTDFLPVRLPPPSYEYFKLPDINLASYWSWTEGSGPVYILENTMEKEAQTGDKVTRLIFEITLRRDRNAMNTTENANTTSPPPVVGPFFVFKGGRQQASKYLYNNVYYENDERKYFYIIRPQDMELYASGTVTEHQIMPDFREGLLDEINNFKAENPDFDFSDWENEDAAKSENLLFYNSGKLYYEIPIEHFTKAKAGGSGEYGRFGIVRNNWYKLKINEILSLGSLTIPARSSELIESPDSGKNNYTSQNAFIIGKTPDNDK